MKRIQAWALVVGAVLAGAALAQTGNRSATIVVRVPGDATVTIGGQATTQRGNPRRFESPDLAPGKTYSYEIEARWTDGGKEVKAMRTVEFTPGQTAVVDFTAKQVAATPKVETKVEPKVVKVEPKVVKVEPKVTKVEPKVVKQPETPKVAQQAVKSRNYLFTYGGTVKDLKPGQEAKIWLPVPVNTAEQKITIAKKELPGKEQIGKEGQYGNTILFVQGKADDKGEIPFKITYKVHRLEVKTNVKTNLVLKPKEPEDKLDRFLKPDAKVPVSGKPLDLLQESLKDKKLPGEQFAAAKVLYDVVNTHMKYSKEGKGWGQGDSVWACDSKFGNCTDFHSLFISMARGNKIPAKFEMGFPIPPKRGEGVVGGYHCWAWFLPDGKGWVPVDISEANRFPEMREYYFGNLTEDRVQFTTGRDIDLVPRQDGPALNFFIYPYVEVNGKAYPAEKVTRSFAYQDQ